MEHFVHQYLSALSDVGIMDASKALSHEGFLAHSSDVCQKLPLFHSHLEPSIEYCSFSRSVDKLKVFVDQYFESLVCLDLSFVNCSLSGLSFNLTLKLNELLLHTLRIVLKLALLLFKFNNHLFFLRSLLLLSVFGRMSLQSRYCQIKYLPFSVKNAINHQLLSSTI